MKKLGLYIHIPFCRSKCLYCDFCSFPNRNEQTVCRYVDRLCREIAEASALCKDHRVDTVYFGGGTPTLLPIEQLTRILHCVFAYYQVDENAEITAECNPKTGGAAYFARMRQAGFNRLSIGLQSVHGRELRALGRLHDFDAFCRTLQEARDAGFTNISADVMFGIPHQTEESWQQTLHSLCKLPLTHISAYGLTVEENTPFGRMGERLILPDEESTRGMYLKGCEILGNYGFSQYEISNFARSGYESRHNLKYWNCEEYLGFGPAAYSDFAGERFGNQAALDPYLEGGATIDARECPDRKERINEYVMLQMRLCRGLQKGACDARFGESVWERFSARLSKYESNGLVRSTPQSVAFTPAGMYVSNAVLSDILD